ncbi:hypothetical protein [Tateyamaria sp. SN6-1]|uniref:hypothetical protein n=1 Tax=Tateyamaria sp. SN6-1 TaxID=3092148 RepID=UPI0039F46F30
MAAATPNKSGLAGGHMERLKTSYHRFDALRHTEAAHRGAAIGPKTVRFLVTLLVTVCICGLFGFVDPEARIGGPAGPEKRWFIAEIGFRMVMCGLLFTLTFYICRGDRTGFAFLLSFLFACALLVAGIAAYVVGLMTHVWSADVAMTRVLAGPGTWSHTVTDLSTEVRYYTSKHTTEIGGPGFTLFAWSVEAFYLAICTVGAWLLARGQHVHGGAQS